METDPRWVPLAELRDEIVAELGLGIAIWEDHRREPEGMGRRMAEKAMQKAFQDAYSSVESVLTRLLALAGEPKPSGPDWHLDLLTVATRPSARRPAFAPDLTVELDELRSFRHVAIHNYRRFRMDRAEPTVLAARQLLARLPAAFDEFGRAFGLLPPDEP